MGSVGTTALEDSPWATHVRETLAQLQVQLHNGTLRLHYYEGRYVLRAASAAGRDIVLPTREGVLVAPSPPPRSCKGLFSPYTIVEPGRRAKPVHVPWAAIARIHGYGQTLADDACRGCAWERCAHGWPEASALNPAAIVVLRLVVDAYQPLYGWYLNVVHPTDADTKRLVPLPRVVRERLIEFMSNDHLLSNSALLRKYNNQGAADYMLEGRGFNATARRRFKRYRERVVSAVHKNKQSRKRRRERGEGEEEFSGAALETEVGTCLICLDDNPRAADRCRQTGCAAVVCKDCHVASRGLCPICDRAALNADYPCAACHRLIPLRRYGYACVGCGDHSLCQECYSSFGECLACATRPVDSCQ
jgi:hypothetical protein